MNLPPWSYTMLSSFENCPKQAFHRYLLKEKGPETEAQRKGNELDKAIEDCIQKGAPMPAEWQQYDRLAKSIAALKGGGTKVSTQLKMGITREFQPCAFFADDVWGRGVLDVALVKAPTAIIVDWKTGKNKEGKAWDDDGLQLKIFAAMVFKHFPKVNKVTAFNVWLKTNEFGKVRSWNREDQAELWREILPLVLKVEKAFTTQEWPACKGPLCAWCPVVTCNFNPQRR